MKKGLIIGAVALIVIVVLGFLSYPQEKLPQEELSQYQILEIIKPEIQFYCQSLDDMATYSHCVICGGSYSGELEDNNYVYVTSFDEGQRERYKYTIEDRGENYLVRSQIYTIAGRNDRPAGYSVLTFSIGKKGNIINSDIPEASECPLQ